jgi:hypothetical protein
MDNEPRGVTGTVDGVNTPRREGSIPAVLAGLLLAAGLTLAHSTAAADTGHVAAGWVLRVSVAEAVGGKTVIGQLTVDRATEKGFVTAYGCDDGLPSASDGAVTRSDVNYDGDVTPAASNRLIVEADDDGDVCFYTSATVDLIVDLNAVSFDTGIFSFPNRRIDTRSGTGGVTIAPGGGAEAPVWPPYEPSPQLAGVAALTGEPADADVTGRPILAAKIDNFRLARPQWALDEADAIIEVNVEGVTRFIALFHSQLPAELGPVRSARTGDLDLLTAMNRPVFAYSGANPGVTAWVGSAASSGVLIDFTAMSGPCYRRDPDRPGPHNLLIDPACAVDAATTAGPARPLWTTDPAWTAPAEAAVVADTMFSVRMDGVDVGWTWDAATGTYLRTQDGAPHVAVSGQQIAANSVVEISALHARSPVDERSPHPITVGKGDAVVHRDGLAITGTWSRPTAYDAFTFVDRASGTAIPLDLGTTFVEVVRAG